MSNNSIDIIGIEKLIKYIEASGKTKFSIYRAGQNGMNIPVFECLDTQTNGNAVKEFIRWSEVINNSVIYKLILFNVSTLDTDEEGNLTAKKSKQKTGKMECLFAVNEPSQYTRSEAGGRSGVNEIEEYKRQLDERYKKKEEDNLILNELKSMRQEIEVLRAQNAELEEEEEEEIGGLTNPSQLKDVMQLIALFKGVPQSPPVLNGTEEAQAQAQSLNKIKIDNINKAVKRLFVHDKNLDTDLLLLADMAEKDKGTFEMLLGMLRSK